MKALRVGIVYFSLATTSGCQKDVLSEGEKTAQSVQAIVSERNITRVNVYTGSIRQQYDVPFAIQGQFLVFTNGSSSNRQYYNLSKLTQFNISTNVNNGPLVAQFYF
jgi:hypothetical protein